MYIFFIIESNFFEIIKWMYILNKYPIKDNLKKN